MILNRMTFRRIKLNRVTLSKNYALNNDKQNDTKPNGKQSTVNKSLDGSMYPG
jgi:hypothetical protein